MVSDLSLVRLNSSQVDDSHQAVEATVSRPAKKDLVYTRKPVWKSWKCEGRDNIMPLYYPLTCHISIDLFRVHRFHGLLLLSPQPKKIREILGEPYSSGIAVYCMDFCSCLPLLTFSRACCYVITHVKIQELGIDFR